MKSKEYIKIILTGNANVGKTTLYNCLTRSFEHIGNWHGVTVSAVEKRMLYKGSELVIEDLPGIYSLTPYTGEERIARDYILKQAPDGIINIVDATNIERNLYLTLQILELGIPVVIALNMMDELQNNGGSVRLPEIIAELGVPVVPVCAVKNEGVDELVRQVAATVASKTPPRKIDFYESGAVHRCIHGI